MKIGLTGNIGAGKSTVAQMLRDLGICVLDADPLAHSLYKDHPTILPVLQQQFGLNVVQQGLLQRDILSQIVFSNPEKLKTLNSIIKPFLRKSLCSAVEKANQKHSIVALEASLLFENDFLDYWDQILLITAPDEIRIQRVMSRGYSLSEAQQRLDSQWPQEQKISQAHYHISNHNNIDTLQNSVNAYYKSLR